MKEFQDELVLPPDLPMPVVAAIDGYCLGAGIEFTMACDFRLATPESELGFFLVTTRDPPGQRGHPATRLAGRLESRQGTGDIG